MCARFLVDLVHRSPRDGALNALSILDPIAHARMVVHSYEHQYSFGSDSANNLFCMTSSSLPQTRWSRIITSRVSPKLKQCSSNTNVATTRLFLMASVYNYQTILL